MKNSDHRIKRRCKFSLEETDPFDGLFRYCRGIVGVVDLPSMILEPTHNKQSFADEKEYHFLLKSMAEFIREYWTDTGIENYAKEFWENYGKMRWIPCRFDEIVE